MWDAIYSLISSGHLVEFDYYRSQRGNTIDVTITTPSKDGTVEDNVDIRTFPDTGNGDIIAYLENYEVEVH